MNGSKQWILLIGLLLSLPARAQQGVATRLPQGTGGQLEINREPVLEALVHLQLLQFEEDGTASPTRTESAQTLRPGSTGVSHFSFAGGARIRVETELLELSASRLTLSVEVVDSRSEEVLTSRQVALEDRQELFVEIAEAASGKGKMVLRLLPLIQAKPAVKDYPGLVKEFGVLGSILILNRKELLVNGSGVISQNEQLSEEIIQTLMITNPRFGRFYLSYRPFPDARVAGYVDGNRLLFEWDGNQFEWTSTESPILPQGRWTLYVSHTDYRREFAREFSTGSGNSPSIGGPSGDFTSIGAWDRKIADFQQ